MIALRCKLVRDVRVEGKGGGAVGEARGPA